MMRIEVVGDGRLAQALRQTLRCAAGWTLADKDAQPDWVVLCTPRGIPAGQVAVWAARVGGLLCTPYTAWDNEAARELAKLAARGQAKALRPECFRPWIAGLQEALAGEWLGAVGTVELIRKRPLSGGDVLDALSQCGMEEASTALHLLGRPRRLFCTMADLGQTGQQASLTMQMASGALVNIQAVQGGTDVPYFCYEYAGQYGLAEYDSRQGALRWNGNEEPWDERACIRAVEQALQSPDDNGLTDLLRLASAARQSAVNRQVVDWEEAQM